MSIKKLLKSEVDVEYTISGWVKSVRAQKNFTFLEINDGSSMAHLQVIAPPNINAGITTGSSVQIKGKLVKSPEGAKQKVELAADEVLLVGSCPEDYPLQKKHHTVEFLRTIAHLRPRTNLQGAILRVRSVLSFATHQFFQGQGFIYLNTPIITTSDCEGGGEMFNITTLDLKHVPKTKEGEVDFSKDFFGQKAFLTVSGQLNAECVACALSNVYTFGPTFRAENSHTTRHLAEFWMMEPEIAFADLKTVRHSAESYIKFVTKAALEQCHEELEFFEKFIEEGLIKRLELVANKPFAHIPYTEAISILQKCGKTFDYPVQWGIDLQTEHERYLAEEHCKKPVIVTDYPKEIKAFYMRMNPDEKTVAAMDILVPKIGELVGGSQREERYDRLKVRLEELKLPMDAYQWYLDLRKYGTVPHGGYGVGFERLVQFITGVENIRDVIPFPRFPGSATF